MILNSNENCICSRCLFRWCLRLYSLLSITTFCYLNWDTHNKRDVHEILPKFHAIMWKELRIFDSPQKQLVWCHKVTISHITRLRELCMYVYDAWKPTQAVTSFIVLLWNVSSNSTTSPSPENVQLIRRFNLEQFPRTHFFQKSLSWRYWLV